MRGKVKDIAGLEEKINELEKREALLKEQFLAFRQHIDNTPLAIVEFDRDFRITGWSANAEKIFGWKAEEVTGLFVYDFRWVHDEDAEKIADLIKEMQSLKNARIHNINRNYRKDGSVIVCEWNNSVLSDNEGKVISTICFIQDVTLKTGLEQKLIHSHHLMQYVIEHSRSAIAVHDRDMRYIYVSQRYISEYGIKDESIIGKHHYDVFPDLPQKWRDVHQRALKGEILSADDDPYERASGKTEWTRWECRPWYENDGTIGGIIVYTEVITKKKEAELELVRAKERAEQSDRLKTAFLQNMSHEIRTPLNTIVGFSQLLSETEWKDESLKSYARMISASSDRLVRIVSDVIEISQIQTKQATVVLRNTDIPAMLTCIVSDFREVASKKNIKFTFDQKIGTTDAEILTDARKLEKIFTHLIDNAVKFTPSGQVIVTCEKVSRKVQLTVTDTGIGIPAEMQDTIFEPFRQLETDMSRTYGGNGLGLTIVRAYTELLKGEMHVESEQGRGTKVTVIIPDAKSPEKQKRTTNLRKAPPEGSILIVEDEYTSYRYLQELLKGTNMNILRAVNGLQAVEMCSSDPAISIVLMDVKMPVMDGETAAKKIRALREDLPIIAQTAFVIESERNRYLRTFDDIITKPINKSEFLDLIRKYTGD